MSKEIKLFGLPSSYLKFYDVSSMAPNVCGLGCIMQTGFDKDAKGYSVWPCALMRTSSRPVDMVFNIMRFFDVKLDPSEFGKNDRIKATIALARAIQKKGGRAGWLASAALIPPSRHISTFPIFSLTSVAGRAYAKVRNHSEEVLSLMKNEYINADALGAHAIRRNG